MGAYDRIPSDLAIFRQESPNGVRWRSIPEHDTLAISMRTGIRYIFLLVQQGILGPPPLFKLSK
jgi:hypothetical protein